MMNWWQRLLLLHAARLFLLLPTACYALIPPSSSLYTAKSSVASTLSWNSKQIPPRISSSIERTSTSLFAASSSAEPIIKSATSEQSDINNLEAAITHHLNEAATAQSQKDITQQRTAVDNAAQLLIQWVDLFRGVTNTADNSASKELDDVTIPGEDVFQSVIKGYLSLPSSIRLAQQQQQQQANEEVQECITDNCQEELAEKNQIKSLLGKKPINGVVAPASAVGGRADNNHHHHSSQPPHLATHILDVMESYHEPTPELYDEIIASFGTCALEYLSQIPSLTIESGNDNDGGDDVDDTKNEILKENMMQNVNDEQSKQYSLYYSHAWKSAKAALQLLNRSEDLYHETGKSSNRLPGVSSYATVMDVYKALAVNSADVLLLVDSKKNSRDEALNVWKNLRQRRLEMYRLNENNGIGGATTTEEGGGVGVVLVVDTIFFRGM